jgi:nucleoside-diphosphate-sugar epimerase
MNAYRGTPVLVIGGLGYIGSNLVSALLDADAAVTVVTPLRARHSDDAARVESRGGRVIEASVRDAGAMRAVVRGQGVVFNVSGQSGAVQSVQEPFVDLDVNCAGSLTLLEALRLDAPTAKLVFTGSRLVYGAPLALPVAEDHPIAPLCPHGAHKATVEQYLAMYGRLYGIRSTTLRITNPYGPGQPAARSAYGVINFLIHRALAREALPIFGDGAQLRDYVFIGDVVSALLLAGADARSDGRVYNVGSGVGTSMIDMARLVVGIVGGGRIEHQAWPPLVHEIDTGGFVADVSRIAAEIGWRPTTALADGLRQTVTTVVENGIGAAARAAE